jgi:hypothetical protein
MSFENPIDKYIHDPIESVDSFQKIDQIKSVISDRKGVASNNFFKVVIAGPRSAGSSKDSGSVFDKAFSVVKKVNKFVSGYHISMLCDSIVMPGRNISTTEYNNGRQNVKTPYTSIDSEVKATFIVTNDNMVREFFEDWMEKVFDPYKYSAGYKSDYVSDMEIHHLNRNGGRVYAKKLVNAYPTNINEYTLSNSEENSVAKIDVTFAYDYHIDADRRLNVLGELTGKVGEVIDFANAAKSIKNFF